MRDLFLKYCADKKASYLPIKGNFYGVSFTSNNNIVLFKNNGGALWVPEKNVFEIESDLKKFLGKENFFIYGMKKAKNLKTIL